MFKTVGHSSIFNTCINKNHNWTTVKDNGFSIYEECRHHLCKTRRVLQRNGGYQPIDNEWLQFRKDNLDT